MQSYVGVRGCQERTACAMVACSMVWRRRCSLQVSGQMICGAAGGCTGCQGIAAQTHTACAAAVLVRVSECCILRKQGQRHLHKTHDSPPSRRRAPIKAALRRPAEAMISCVSPKLACCNVPALHDDQHCCRAICVALLSASQQQNHRRAD